MNSTSRHREAARRARRLEFAREVRNQSTDRLLELIDSLEAEHGAREKEQEAQKQLDVCNYFRA